ncbi:dicarboxylate/amino acid:cation symporter [Calothrix sp. PCC 6303]|uniref:dicarboxylate/amino acid:cation symporter n=1 Tax=Calothrix sp. PCC 6303 TaxID=1170562 RepID=UPI0002A01AB1|nr:dicarboxylate/amino acid:cation symporter [Calothrix sp. PCC 6303]AFZ02406.1 sodium:dicarboxylate symporter [Calothrix sp. PCC 6303]
MNEPEHTKRPIWMRIPLTLQILIALILAIAFGIFLGGGNPTESNKVLIDNLAIPADLILKALRALAPPLILVAVLHTFMTAEIPGRAGRKLGILLITNTTVAIFIGLLVANILRPGRWGRLTPPTVIDAAAETSKLDPWGLIQDAIPKAILEPLVSNNVIQLIVIALSFGIVLRAIKSEMISQGKDGYKPIEDVVGILFEAVIRILGWVIALVPLAVFGIVSKTVAKEGFQPFISLGAFILAVLVALFLQGCYYLTRVKLESWVKPIDFLRGGTDAFLTAFSTSSSGATMPITFEVLQEKIGLRESSAALGSLVGANFNNDGTALYEAMSALFISQVLGQHLNLGQQFLVVLTSIFASVGAANIPNAGLVTMTLVFQSVGLPTQYIAVLVTVDWFLDRCRTAINVMGDMTVSTLIDGKKPKTQDNQLLG